MSIVHAGPGVKFAPNNITVIFKYIHNHKGTIIDDQHLIFCSGRRPFKIGDNECYKNSVIQSVKMNEFCPRKWP